MRVDGSDHPLLQPDNGGHAEQPPLLEEKWRRKLRRRPLAARRRPRRSGKTARGCSMDTPSFCTQLARLSRRREAGTRGEGIRQQPGRVPGGSSQVLARMTRSHTHTDERGDSHGKESSQGREEEGGRKEAVSAATRSPWGAKVCAPVFCTSPATGRRPRHAPAAPRPTDAAARRLPSR